MTVPKKNPGYLSINKVAMMLDVSDHTIRRWYKWWESPEFEKPEDLFLPVYYSMDRRGTKFFREEDIGYLKEFRNKIQSTHRGVMSQFNAAYSWGKRGTRALENKGTTRNETLGRIR